MDMDVGVGVGVGADVGVSEGQSALLGLVSLRTMWLPFPVLSKCGFPAPALLSHCKVVCCYTATHAIRLSMCIPHKQAPGSEPAEACNANQKRPRQVCYYWLMRGEVLTYVYLIMLITLISLLV